MLFCLIPHFVLTLTPSLNMFKSSKDKDKKEEKKEKDKKEKDEKKEKAEEKKEKKVPTLPPVAPASNGSSSPRKAGSTSPRKGEKESSSPQKGEGNSSPRARAQSAAASPRQHSIARLPLAQNSSAPSARPASPRGGTVSPRGIPSLGLSSLTKSDGAVGQVEAEWDKMEFARFVNDKVGTAPVLPRQDSHCHNFYYVSISFFISFSFTDRLFSLFIDSPPPIVKGIAGRYGFTGDEEVMDFSCGTGLLAEAIAKSVRSVFAIDAMPTMITDFQANLLKTPKIAKKIEARHMFLTSKTQLGDRRFDLIVTASDPLDPVFGSFFDLRPCPDVLT